MSRFTSVFSQLLQLFSRLDLQRAAKATNAERHARGFTCWGQFVAMLFCQLGRAKSLREICGGLAACEGKLSHLGITAPKRATMAYANEHRPWQLYKAVFFQLLGRCQAVAQGRLLRSIFASVAEYERELIRERVKAGLARARARGRRLGCPPRAVDLTQVTALRQAGSSWRRIAQALTVPTSTVYRAAWG